MRIEVLRSPAQDANLSESNRKSRRRKAPVRGYRDDGRWRAALRERFPVGIAIFYSGIHESARPIVTGPTAATDVISGSRRVARCVIHVRSCTLKHIPNVWSIEPNAKHHPRRHSRLLRPRPALALPSPRSRGDHHLPHHLSLRQRLERLPRALQRKRVRHRHVQSRLGRQARQVPETPRGVSGSRVACAPQYTPCTVTFFTSARLSGSFGIFPHANPMTSACPPQRTALNPSANASPPTGSNNASTPRSSPNARATADLSPAYGRAFGVGVGPRSGFEPARVSSETSALASRQWSAPARDTPPSSPLRWPRQPPRRRALWRSEPPRGPHHRRRRARGRDLPDLRWRDARERRDWCRMRPGTRPLARGSSRRGLEGTPRTRRGSQPRPPWRLRR